jgi:hypothetical protein
MGARLWVVVCAGILKWAAAFPTATRCGCIFLLLHAARSQDLKTGHSASLLSELTQEEDIIRLHRNLEPGGIAVAGFFLRHRLSENTHGYDSAAFSKVVGIALIFMIFRSFIALWR